MKKGTNMSQENDKFLEMYKKALQDAQQIVEDHSNDGENEVFSIDQMYPHGIQDILFMIYHKVTRILGYHKKGNHLKVVDELQDVINYAGFGLAWYLLKGSPKE